MICYWMHSIKLKVQSFIRQAANKLLDICALPQLCEAWLALRALWKMMCLLAEWYLENESMIS